MKKENSKIMLWVVIALVVGIVLGMLITNLTTTGHAVKSITSDYSLKEIQEYSKITPLENGVTQYDFITNSNGDIIDYKTDSGDSCQCHAGNCNCGDRCITYIYHPGETTPYSAEWSTCMKNFIPSSEYYNQYK